MNRSKPVRLVRLVHITALLGVLLPSGPAAADTVQQRTAHLIEWDLPVSADASPGAMIVDSQGHDNNRLWFVTRLGIPRVFRLSPPKSLMKGPADWTSWELGEDSIFTGGTKRVRASYNRRFVFVRTAQSLQRIDTQNCDNYTYPPTCQRIEWADQPGSFNVSDLTVDDLDRVFTTAAVGDPLNPMLAQSYVQMLAPGTVPANGQTGTATLTRWTVGGGAGFCADLGVSANNSFPCLSGIAVHPRNHNLIYYSEPEGTDSIGNIGELDIYTKKIRRWSLAALPPDEAGPVRQPRQLIIDRWGVVWVITGSGHLVSLDPSCNRMRRHAIPAALGSDPFGLAPDDDVVGYTDTTNSKVGMMFPLGTTFYVTPTWGTAPVSYPSVPVVGARAKVETGCVTPKGKVVTAQVTTKPDGVFVEAFVGIFGGNDSESPLGITPNKGKGQGTFFYAVGLAGNGANRVGFVRLPMVKHVKHPRDDDDTDDGGDEHTHPGWHNRDVDDDDDDGFSDQYDDSHAKENVQVGDQAPLQPGQWADYPMTTTPTSLALIAVDEADSPTALLAIDIYNALGTLVASSPTMPGTAAAAVLLPAPGSYIARVRNLGMAGVAHTPTLIVREPWIP